MIDGSDTSLPCSYSTMMEQHQAYLNRTRGAWDYHHYDCDQCKEVEGCTLDKKGKGLTPPAGRILTDRETRRMGIELGEFYPCKPDIFEATYEKAE
jgi:hypothetical protein